ncbi:ATP-dependent zinc metalloprotease FtsH [Acidicapsa dinghuensis]|uniref:ATP-dependent zinc metalloprotease FtsH n=1 Tax=Acidicapsa dinghuensis TaxID=2218256 RepID=A0ABW1EMG8_9BACT|nr:ATP-dependent zinc metalloprotease FtsH [Acidicapsa dinghuensis]
MNSTVKTIMFWAFIVICLVLLFGVVQKSAVMGGKEQEIPFSTFLERVQQGQVNDVTVQSMEVHGHLKGDGKELTGFHTEVPANYPNMYDLLNQAKVQVTIKDAQGNMLWPILIQIGPLVLILGIWFFIMRQMQSGGNKAMSFGKSRARLLSMQQKKVTFKDVAGVDEAKEELKEIIEYLREPQRFQKLGGRIPKGVLLVGPPGTGKTLLARAVAGEANVPFFSISGSDFVEMFVGVGASRVRDLFEQGKKNAPCIIFIDEIDAVGRHRGAGLGGGHDEREQTLNQLLVEMDGFESNDGVILVAATNRPDVLDPALLRPGRFDRRVVVGLPDVRGREEVLRVHVKKVPVAEDVNLNVLARGTPGFSGADLANMVNEAALNAARVNRKQVTMYDLEIAKDKVLMGAERKSMLLTDEEKRVTAYHEAGHALVSVLRDHTDPIHKVTIIPRGMALGVTVYLPGDRHNYTREYLETRLATAYGGRVAEEIFLGQMSTGAGSDIENATDLARRMVCEYGMSRLGPLTFGKKEEQIFLGREIAQHRDFSEETARQIDQEVRRLIDEAYQSAYTLVDTHKDAMHRIANALLERETIDAEEVRLLIEGKELPSVRSSLASPTDQGGGIQQVLKPESGRGGPGFPEGSPSPA